MKRKAKRKRNRQRCEISSEFGNGWQTLAMPARRVWKALRDAAKRKDWQGSIVSVIRKGGAT